MTNPRHVNHNIFGRIQPAFLFDLFVLYLRIMIGSFFVWGGYHKLSGGIENFINGPFTALKPSWLSDWIALPYAYCLPFFDLIFGSLLIIGLFTRLTASVLSLLLISFLIALACKFGITATTDAHIPFHTNYIMLGAAFVIIFIGSQRISIDYVITLIRSRNNDS